MKLPLWAAPPPDEAPPSAPPALEEALLEEVFAYVSRRVWRREEAEDVAAETIAAAYAHWHRFRDGDRRLWVLGIARRKTADALRRQSKRRETALSDALPSSDLPDHAERREAATRLRAIVLGLPDDQREALLLQHLEGLSIDEIATVMGRSPAAVNSLLQRARARAYRDGRAYFLASEDQP